MSGLSGNVRADLAHGKGDYRGMSGALELEHAHGELKLEDLQDPTGLDDDGGGVVEQGGRLLFLALGHQLRGFSLHRHHVLRRIALRVCCKGP